MGAWKQEQQSLVPTVQPTEVDVAYCAGFYEGEGSASQSRSGGCIVQVPQKDPEVLYRIRSMWGGSVRPVAGRDIFAWVITGDRARVFLQAIYPMMSGRRKGQIDRVKPFELTGKRGVEVSGLTPERQELRATMTDTQRHSETCIRWQQNNPEKAREISKRFRDKNRDLVNARQRERRAKLRDMKSYTSNDEGSQLVN